MTTSVVKLSKKAVSKLWSEIILAHSTGEEVRLTKYRTTLIELLSQTYFRSKLETGVQFKIDTIKVGTRKVKILTLIPYNEPANKIKISKQKMLSLLFPSTSPAPTKEHQHYCKTLTVLRQLVEPQIREFRQKNPKVNWIAFDVDHCNLPFIQLVENWLEQKNLYYIDLKLKGPVNKKYLTDTTLALDWQNYHKANAVLKPMLKTKNRAKGAENWFGTKRLGSFKRKTTEEFDLTF